MQQSIELQKDKESNYKQYSLVHIYRLHHINTK